MNWSKKRPPPEPQHASPAASATEFGHEVTATSYRIPKNRIAAVIAAVGEAPVEVGLFVCSHAAQHDGPERPSDLLSADDAFLPVDAADGVVLVHKACLRFVTVASELEIADLEAEAQHAAERRDVVTIHFDDGTMLSGTLVHTLPDSKQRVLDFLNEAPAFFPLRERHSMHLVNRNRVVRVSTASVR